MRVIGKEKQRQEEKKTQTQKERGKKAETKSTLREILHKYITLPP